MSRPPLTPAHVAAVALGGALGASARWGLSDLVPDGLGFPWTTFAINVTGCLLLALLPALAVVRRHPVLPLFLGTGVLGGYTTLSTYCEEARALVADGSTGMAGAYVLGTLAAAMVAVEFAHRWSTPAAQQEFDDEEGDE
ncbi:fluoride efflux transporter FluC [Nocardioides jensenii]|uniref:fluoride efflux transporter FluC n=1 Tax=Nocardioides jensenii TaxID=1843 RepID=UPI0009EC2BF4|nr:CrcB family protein [Nocardioides jensenii]